MKYIQLGSGIPEVSRLSLGTVFFGTTVSKQDSFKQMDAFFEKGGNFIDSARVYADWLPEGHGASEKTIGAWIKERKNRSRIVLSTKGAHPNLKTMNIARMSLAEVQSDLEDSLADLGTDYIDLYFLHRDDESRPVEEILSMLESFRKTGKIRHYGCSNWALARMEEADKVAAAKGYEGFLCDQIRYSLGDLNLDAIEDKTCIAMDKPIFAYHEKSKKAVMAYSSTCHGYFPKRLKGRAVSPSHEAVYSNDSNKKLLERLPAWEKQCRISAAALVPAYVAAQDFPSIPIVAFSSLEQLEEVIPAGDASLPRELLDEIRGIKKFTF
ncbi:aldo/keto reductase [Leadbettera azotonutricia]|uniref:Oxidoreductase n=1 Tax=Leadbettera azotonutricia (strain ATCC BAA-888 / DSM 13862 / ZAS-9) TaxID=545695 RepID=F5Y7E0_LEAAZ|nr:aldo/keto reductase [Leadbettera azotonutricia]AEF80414.1 oxidoreductase [Leadbettera azotonutricia ZAS-9]